MKREDLIEAVKLALGEATRKNNIPDSSNVFTKLPDVVASVVIDRNEILECIKNEAQKTGTNPFAVLAKFLGLNITEKTVDGVRIEIDKTYSDTNDNRTFLSINESDLKNNLTDIIKAFVTVIDENESKINELKKQNENLRMELNKTNDTFKQLKTDDEGVIQTVAERIQYIYSLIDPNEKTPVKDQLDELLLDLDMKAVWNADNTEFSENMMFKVLKSTEAEKKKKKPCIILNNEVFIKGLLFVSSDDIAE